MLFREIKLDFFRGNFTKVRQQIKEIPEDYRLRADILENIMEAIEGNYSHFVSTGDELVERAYQTDDPHAIMEAIFFRWDSGGVLFRWLGIYTPKDVFNSSLAMIDDIILENSFTPQNFELIEMLSLIKSKNSLFYLVYDSSEKCLKEIEEAIHIAEEINSPFLSS